MVTTTGGQLEQLGEQIREDLSGVLTGEVRSDTGTAALYATDASLHQLRPLAVAFPKNADDVAAIVRYAADQNLPVISRGGGTGLAGSALGSGIVVDFSRHMNQILQIRDRTVVVQPGVVLDDLNRALAPTGRHFAPDPSNASITTLGGMIGVDAAGSRAVRVGSTRDHLAELQVVLADGTIQWLGQEPVMPGVSGAISNEEGAAHDQFARVRVILRRLAAILNENEKLIAEHQPPLLRNTAGYMLRNVLRSGRLDVPRLFAGSEGTLGLCTEAVLHTSPLPTARSVMLVLFSRFDLATQALPGILEFELSACDLLDRRLLTLAREAEVCRTISIPAHAEAALIVEFVASDERLLQQRCDRFQTFVRNELSGATVCQQTHGADEAERLWRLPRQVVPLLSRIRGTARPVPIIEDVVIPPPLIGEFLHQAQRVLQRYQVTASLYAHVGSGQLHLRPFLDLPTSETKTTYEALARDLYRVVLEHGGSISGEHGDGFSRTAFIRTQYGPLYRVFQQVKQLFDPQNILNPEKIVSSDPHLTIRHLRPDAELVTLEDRTGNQLTWNNAELAQAARECNGCGNCKSHAADLRMCPFHRVEPTEYNSPRAKANTIRQTLWEKITAVDEESAPSVTDLSAPEMLNSCFNCKQCQRECPSEVNIPHLWLEAKAADVQQNGLSRTDWILSRISRVVDWTSSFSWLVNLAVRTRGGRWLLERTFGIDSRRRLPALARRSYLDQVRLRNRKKKNRNEQATSPETRKPVVIFLDYYSNYHDPGIVEALEAILRHNDIPYVVPEDQEVSGMTLINVGDLVAAREIAEKNLRVLGPYAREGHPILCIEPSSAVCFSVDYPRLIEHPDIAPLARSVWEAGAFLANLHRKGELKTDFAPMRTQVGYHEPCHQKTLSTENPYDALLELIPGLSLRQIEKGCSGMAGVFGLSKRNYEQSVAMGAGLIKAVAHEKFDIASAECSACRLQMQHAEAKPVIHPLKLVAAAYGLIPRPRELEQSYAKPEAEAKPEGDA
ncbi:MAG: FAD-binding and (Fe-S)-binding domain-containing protein [Rubinisphaera brasiliensis]|uniref:FAD-binding and (Fe-S)-binding domain-containing protein n=1 Tax=Rubinisphaera brasiliensis TaxID=119 RepID=UPI00391C0D39